MAHTRSFDKTDPANSGKAGLGAQELRELKEDVEERMQLDHYWDNENDTSETDADGHHKQVTMEKKSVAPSAIADTGIVYVKDDTIAELHYKNIDSDIQVTKDGKLNRDSLEKDYTICSIGACSAGFIEFDTVDSDAKSRFDTEDFQYKPGKDGVYLVIVNISDATVGQSSSGSSQTYGLKVYLNGVVYKSFAYANQCACLIELETGDYVEIYTDKAISGADAFFMRLV